MPEAQQRTHQGLASVFPAARLNTGAINWSMTTYEALNLSIQAADLAVAILVLWWTARQPL